MADRSSSFVTIFFLGFFSLFFYAFPNFEYYLGKSFNGKEIKNSFDLSDLFLDIAKVVTVPGDGFGAPAHIRFSYPIGKKLINDGINRVKNILDQLN